MKNYHICYIKLTPSVLKESIPGVKKCPQISRFLEDDGPPGHLILHVFPFYLLLYPLPLANFAPARK
jgi:hypothetical protein